MKPKEEASGALPSWVEYLSLGAILFSVASFPLETLPDPSRSQKAFFEVSEALIVALFTLEYCMRLWRSPRKSDYVFSFYGIVDLLAILPFYLVPVLDFRSLRLVRLLRFTRLLKIVRYSKALQRFGKALLLAREEFVVFSLVSLVTIYLSAVGIYYFEQEVQPQSFGTVFDCLWWAVATLTTVGYGDLYPVTSGGRFFTFVILMLGLGFVAIPTGIIPSALTSVRHQDAVGHQDAVDNYGDQIATPAANPAIRRHSGL